VDADHPTQGWAFATSAARSQSFRRQLIDTEADTGVLLNQRSVVFFADGLPEVVMMRPAQQQSNSSEAFAFDFDRDADFNVKLRVGQPALATDGHTVVLSVSIPGTEHDAAVSRQPLAAPVRGPRPTRWQEVTFAAVVPLRVVAPAARRLLRVVVAAEVVDADQHVVANASRVITVSAPPNAALVEAQPARILQARVAGDGEWHVVVALPFRAQLLHARRGAAGARMFAAASPRLASKFVDAVVSLATNTSAARVVPLFGFRAHIAADGTLAFPAATVRLQLPSRPSAPATVQLVVNIPIDDDSIAPHFTTAVTIPTGENPTADVETNVSSDGDGAPILISVTVHECGACVLQLARNIRAFAAPSIVVLHVAASFPDGERAALTAGLQRLNHSQHSGGGGAVVFVVNPAVLAAADGNKLEALSAHLLNLRYYFSGGAAAAAAAGVSHVLFVSSNELFVRGGVVRYVRRFAASEVHRPPRPRDGWLYEQNCDANRGSAAGDGPQFYHGWRPLGAGEEHAQAAAAFWPALPFVPRDDDFLMEALRGTRRAAAAAGSSGRGGSLLSSYVPFEGTFLATHLALRFVEAYEGLDVATQGGDDERRVARDEMWGRAAWGTPAYTTAEVVLQALFANACAAAGACGRRVSSMAWCRRPGDEEGQWGVTRGDVERIRLQASLGQPTVFAVKRVVRNMSNPVRVFIDRLAEETP
jgi:hypothetical protein